MPGARKRLGSDVATPLSQVRRCRSGRLVPPARVQACATSLKPVGDSTGALIRRLGQIGASPGFAYSSLFLIQLRVVWGIWNYRDFPSGDSTGQFVLATHWADQRTVVPIFSPLYSVFWGSQQWFIHDAYSLVTVNRLLIVFAATMLTLAVLRRLVSPAIAWVLAVWWALLPLNYDTVTELHLFAVLPGLVATFVALSWSGVRMRATVLGILLSSAILVRNEMVITALAWLVIWITYEVRTQRKVGQSIPWRHLALAVAAPVVVSMTLGAVAVARAPNPQPLPPEAGSSVFDQFDWKNRFALCQHYALGYQQRHGDFSQSGWTTCQRYMERDFGKPLPSLLQAFEANPGAIGGHFSWNAQLAPYGLQLLLFDRISGPSDRNPDYIATTRTGSGLALAASLALSAFMLVGLLLIWRERRRYWESWLRPRAWGWVVLLGLTAMAVYVMIVIRPRPSYILGLEVPLVAIIGMCAVAMNDRFPILSNLRATIPVVALGMLVAIPSHYSTGYTNPQLSHGRPIKQLVDRLSPIHDQLSGETLLAQWSVEGCAYANGDHPCAGVRLGAWNKRARGTTAEEWLDQHKIRLVYADESNLQAGWLRRDIAGLDPRRWQQLGDGPLGSPRWVLLRRRSAQDTALRSLLSPDVGREDGGAVPRNHLAGSDLEHHGDRPVVDERDPHAGAEDALLRPGLLAESVI